MKSVLIVVTVFALWFSVYFSEAVETVISYILILSFGILHGANDIELIRMTTQGNKGKMPKNRAITLYLLVILGIIGLFFFLPVLALPFFILISGFHFGEQHWAKKVNEQAFLKTIFYSSYGLFILFMIFYTNDEQVGLIVLEVSNLSIPPNGFRNGLFVLGGLLVPFLGYYYFRKWVKSNFFEELFYLGVFFVIFKTASLLWGFCIYFVVWHSVPSLVDQLKYLHGQAGWSSFLDYIKTSWIYWAISILGLGGLYFFLKDDSQFFVSILIYFLAAITFPHVFVMSKLEKS